MALTTTSIAAAVGASVQNVQFRATAQVVPRKILIIGTPTTVGADTGTPTRVLSGADAAAQFGSGSMLHRLCAAAFAGSQGVETWAIPQSEAGGAADATKTITVAVASNEAGTIPLYIAGDRVAVTTTAAQADADIATAIAAAVNAEADLPVTAAAALAVVTLTAKSAGPWGNDISVRSALLAGESLPSGVTLTIADGTAGAGTPDIATALNATGTGDDANGQFFTDVVHGYGTDTATLDAVSTYVGPGNDTTGLYAKTISRPFRSLNGDTAAGSGGFTAVTALGNGRRQDRASGVISVPGSPNHPAEIAAQALGVMARINDNRAEESYVGRILDGVIPGAVDDRWTSQYSNRDTAVQSGVSPTRVRNGVVELQNVVTFYHPADVPVDSNGYRSMRNISILQNILSNIRTNFESERWRGFSIVEDVALVTNIRNREKARDVGSVIDDLVALATDFEGLAWLYTASFTIAQLAEPGAVSVRPGTTGFDSVLKIILSGEGGILDTEVQFDTSIAVL